MRPPGSGWAFLYACAVLLVAPPVFWAPEGPAAREARASLRSAPRLEARLGPAAAHRHRSLVLRTPSVVWLVVLGFWGASLCVVTSVVNRRCFSCGFLIRCYKRRQSEGFFAEIQCFWRQIDDVCNMSTRKGVQTAPV